jgi:uncharacterized Zn finger protein
MSWWDGDDWRERRPRRQVDGIRALTQRGRFGTTWWAGRWLEALEQLVDEGRLSRGRTYARGGQVTKLDAGPQGVRAEVWGSADEPYEVTIDFRPLTDKAWEAVADAMAAKAIYAARLLSGEMPDDVESVFAAAGATLFPAKTADLQTDCTCPDWANPCKHVAAVFYLLGERFDADPFLMFELRGRTQAEVAAALRRRRGPSDAPVEAPEPTGTSGTDAPSRFDVADLLGPETAPLPGAAGDAASEDAGGFWTVPPEGAVVETPVSRAGPAADALPLKQLGTPPFWPAGRSFADEAEAAYRAIAERARRLSTGEAT